MVCKLRSFIENMGDELTKTWTRHRPVGGAVASGSLRALGAVDQRMERRMIWDFIDMQWKQADEIAKRRHGRGGSNLS